MNFTRVFSAAELSQQPSKTPILKDPERSRDQTDSKQKASVTFNPTAVVSSGDVMPSQAEDVKAPVKSVTGPPAEESSGQLTVLTSFTTVSSTANQNTDTSQQIIMTPEMMNSRKL